MAQNFSKFDQTGIQVNPRGIHCCKDVSMDPDLGDELSTAAMAAANTAHRQAPLQHLIR